MRRLLTLAVFVLTTLVAVNASATQARAQAAFGLGLATISDEETDANLENSVGFDLQLAGLISVSDIVFLGGYFNWMSSQHNFEDTEADVAVSLSALGVIGRFELTHVILEANLGYAFGDAEFELGPFDSNVDYGGIQIGGAVFYPIEIARMSSVDVGAYTFASFVNAKEDDNDSDATYFQLGIMAKLTFGTEF